MTRAFRSLGITRLGLFASLLALGVAGCGAAPSGGGTTPTPSEPSAAASNLSEAMARAELTSIELTQVSRDMTSDLTGEVRIEGRVLHVTESAGYGGGRTLFARRRDGGVVRVIPDVEVVVDRHVPGGCLGFAGGRGWFEDVVYELPEGAAYGGDVTVHYVEHTEVIDYSDVSEDGSPCPPPAID